MKWICPQCGFSFENDDATTLPVSCVDTCGFVDETGVGFAAEDGTPVPPRPLVKRAMTLAGAFARWMAAGCPNRSDAEVDSLFRDHCSGCKWFAEDTCTHASCGCQVRDSDGEKASIIGRFVSTALANKLRWRTERCPIGRW